MVYKIQVSWRRSLYESKQQQQRNQRRRLARKEPVCLRPFHGFLHFDFDKVLH